MASQELGWFGKMDHQCQQLKNSPLAHCSEVIGKERVGDGSAGRELTVDYRVKSH